MIRWLVRIIVHIALNDTKCRRAIIKAVNPEWWWDLEYGRLKNPPPKIDFNLMEGLKASHDKYRG